VSALRYTLIGGPNSGLEYLSEEKSKRLDGCGSQAASFARQGEAIRNRNRKTAASYARFGRSEGTDPAGAFPVHPAPTPLERGYSRDCSSPSRVQSLLPPGKGARNQSRILAALGQPRRH